MTITSGHPKDGKCIKKPDDECMNTRPGQGDDVQERGRRHEAMQRDGLCDGDATR